MHHHLAGPTLLKPPVSSLVEALLEATPAKPWLTFHLGKRRETFTHRDIVTQARGWALAFVNRGVQPGDSVLLILPNGPEFVAAFFGAQFAGAVPVPVVSPGALHTRPEQALEATAWPRSVVRPAAIACTPSLAPAFHNAVSGPSEAESLREVRPLPTDPAFLQFTSGTEGPARAIVVTHRAAVHSATAMAQCLDLGPTDVGVSWLPLFHDMGLVGSLLTSLVVDFPLHIMTPPEFLLHPEHWLRTLSKERATITVAPNFAYEFATRRIQPSGERDLSRLRYALNGSEPVQRATIDEFERRFAAEGLKPGTIRPVYGLAEATLGVAFELESAADELLADRLVPSVGRPLPGMEISIRDAVGAELGDGDDGEIWVRGPSVAEEFLVGPNERIAALEDGWLRTGDRGLKRSGKLYVTGRDKDLIIRRGRKYPPYELERVAARAADAPPSGALAFGRYDAELGTEALVIVVECAAKRRSEVMIELPRLMVSELGIRPDRVELVDPGTLPRTSSGKLRRTAWAEEARP